MRGGYVPYVVTNGRPRLIIEAMEEDVQNVQRESNHHSQNRSYSTMLINYFLML